MGAPMEVVLRSEKTSVVALAVAVPSPREMKSSRPAASPVKRELTWLGLGLGSGLGLGLRVEVKG